MIDFPELEKQITACRLCPRLVAHREEVARTRRRAFRDWEYWGKPVPGFGDPAARLLVVGLAPAAHGANRTGRMFTGDRSGDWLYRALFKAGLASQAASTDRQDGLTLKGVFITAACRCAPPDNQPSTQELESCRGFLDAEFRLLAKVKAVLALGRIAFDGALALLERHGLPIPRPRPQFAHGLRLDWAGKWPVVVASYHPSQQNTQTGRLTEAMLDAAVAEAKAAAGLK
ncbi:MAG: uracil-DNA glycosylase [Planctomycetes bacterium]|nr:uracil-DNA glycosylase [Planctomycetota bacterium]